MAPSKPVADLVIEAAKRHKRLTNVGSQLVDAALSSTPTERPKGPVSRNQKRRNRAPESRPDVRPAERAIAPSPIRSLPKPELRRGGASAMAAMMKGKDSA